MRIVKHFIGGRWDGNGSTFETRRPRDLEPLAIVPTADAKTVDDAVKAAKRAGPEWRGAAVEDRAQALLSLVKLLRREYGNERELTQLKQLVIDEVGKPLPEADIEVLETADFIEYFCSIAPVQLALKQIAINSTLWPTKQSWIVVEPRGIVAIIKPWNYPLEMIAWSLAPAILAGNTVVIKPSEKSSATAYFLAQLIEGSEIPSGVVNFVFGDATTGARLVEHPDVAMVSFTGSIAGGRAVAIEAAKGLKKCSLELGGNDAAIVLADANLDTTANGLVWGAFCNSGQVCVGIKRAYVHETIFDELLTLVLEKTKALMIDRDVGPLVDKKQFDAFFEFVEDVKKTGGKVLCGGEAVGGGYQISPVVVELDNDKARLLREECFGPLLPLVRFKDVRAAIQRANASESGLGASIWTSSTQNALAISRELEVGMVWINDVNVAFAEAPWGGCKNSGYGLELSPGVLLEYGMVKHISVETSTDPRRFWWYPYA
jgi:acyl-CoA reductase-like NAD-dependent aldehyde dehydrogenase